MKPIRIRHKIYRFFSAVALPTACVANVATAAASPADFRAGLPLPKEVLCVDPSAFSVHLISFADSSKKLPMHVMVIMEEGDSKLGQQALSRWQAAVCWHVWCGGCSQVHQGQRGAWELERDNPVKAMEKPPLY
ncbi:MAG: hypothetical protein KGQ89_00325 [Verrucomicrobia bacterium]|nr:hypothetical protein [Verrucomicrobiota bacterium]